MIIYMDSSDALIIDANHKGNRVMGKVWAYGHFSIRKDESN